MIIVWNGLCDLGLHINCSICDPAGRVFYRAVKLDTLYGSNSMKHYCLFFFPPLPCYRLSG